MAASIGRAGSAFAPDPGHAPAPGACQGQRQFGEGGLREPQFGVARWPISSRKWPSDEPTRGRPSAANSASRGESAGSHLETSSASKPASSGTKPSCEKTLNDFRSMCAATASPPPRWMSSTASVRSRGVARPGRRSPTPTAAPVGRQQRLLAEERVVAGVGLGEEVAHLRRHALRPRRRRGRGPPRGPLPRWSAPCRRARPSRRRLPRPPPARPGRCPRCCGRRRRSCQAPSPARWPRWPRESSRPRRRATAPCGCAGRHGTTAESGRCALARSTMVSFRHAPDRPSRRAPPEPQLVKAARPSRRCRPCVPKSDSPSPAALSRMSSSGIRPQEKMTALSPA